MQPTLASLQDSLDRIERHLGTEPGCRRLGEPARPLPEHYAENAFKTAPQGSGPWTMAASLAELERLHGIVKDLLKRIEAAGHSDLAEQIYASKFLLEMHHYLVLGPRGDVSEADWYRALARMLSERADSIKWAGGRG